jgi:GGDEF domain-containing protein/CHASE3 domain sensor protein
MNIPIPPKIMAMLVPSRFFARLNIASKMLLGYMTLVALMVVVVGYVLVNLQRINNLAQSVVNVEIKVKEASDRMFDALLTQETYRRRYLILKSEDMRGLFETRGNEFRTWFAVLKELPNRPELPLPVNTIYRLHNKYTDLVAQEAELIRAKNVNTADAVSNREMKGVLDKLLKTLKTLSISAKESQDDKMKQVSLIGGATFLTTVGLCLFSIIVGVLAGLAVTHHIASSIHKLKEATERIAEGNFDYDPKIRTEDEIGNLSKAFLTMGKRLQEVEQMYLDASPLTRLPGGIAIENVLKKRIESKQPLAFCVIDLDNFKAFNDHYGYAKGSEVIKETAKIIEAVVKEKGTSYDFVGHVGGDDYVVITIPDKMREIAGEIITLFDRCIPEFYDPLERQQGYIVGKTRQGIEMRFPIMSISIAIVTNYDRQFTNTLQVSEIAAELKDYAKTIPESSLVVDKRRIT